MNIMKGSLTGAFFLVVIISFSCSFPIERGREMVNSLPLPSVLSTVMEPPCRCTTCQTKFNPSPKPEAPVARLPEATRSNRLNIFICWLWGIPMPLSPTFISRIPSAVTLAESRIRTSFPEYFRALSTRLDRTSCRQKESAVTQRSSAHST